jgi:hypothetical protein
MLAAGRAAMLCPAMRLIHRLFPAFLAAFLIARGSMTPLELLLGRQPLWALFAVFWDIAGFCILVPVRCGVYSYFTSILGFPAAERVYFRSIRAYLRGICYFGCIALFRFMLLLPFAVASMGIYYALRCSAAAADGGLFLFIAVQCAAAALWSGIYYLHFCVGTAAVPLLFLQNPERSALAAVRMSCRMLKGSHWYLLLLTAEGILLPPYLMTSCILFLQIRIQEWLQREEEQYAGAAAYSKKDGILSAGQLSASGLRSVPPTAYTSPAHGKRLVLQRKIRPDH